jgi:hypothetical protein
MKNSLRLNAASLWLIRNQNKLCLLMATNLEWALIENAVLQLKKSLKIVKNPQSRFKQMFKSKNKN